MVNTAQQPAPDDLLALRRSVDQRLVLLRTARNSWRETWREIKHYILPTRGRFFALPNQSARGLPKGLDVIDRTATTAAANLSAFLMAGITSPARDWFRLTTSRDDLNDDPEVKLWLAEVQRRLQRVYASSNFYQGMEQVYEEISGFGTGVSLIQRDYDDVIRLYPLTAGEYYLAMNDRMEIDTVYREYVQNVNQIVGKFGRENCSQTVQSLYDNNMSTQEFQVIHAMFPNLNRRPGALGWRGARYISLYYEYGRNDPTVLRVEGFDYKPFVAPRWQAISNDAYGRGPCEDALGDVKSLQLAQIRLAEVVDKYARPPLMADASLQSGLISLLPNGINFIPGLAQQTGAGLKPIYQTAPDIRPLQERIQEFQAQIKTTLKNDLILMMNEIEGEQPRTATEINVRQQEKLLVLGPVLERFHNEALDPLINTTMNRPGFTGE
ncbi:MAG: portal protein [Gluconacetobacter sp.]|uniref:Phage head-tail adapter protein n=1 Tax=Gluconacetobacter dulcium TaxID=2729096 RepID=A0A7W4PJI1_9PROT|nr:portal protein [Gluconacetobacter dulcium]MBB2199930.1 phage head-tail adapter protein [Gluconacetobacter dulcium]